ncbi:MAG: hypothetical protein JW700_01690 [Candidatus Aenigmarchaeota archaeon]|nr:hypothetical protein [Candidatus Aenigmarchaeota archaeon]
MENLDDIKKAVSSRPFYEPMGAPALPHEVVDINKVIEDAPRIAPVFVRIDRYKEILSGLQDIKTSINNLKSLVNVRKEIHKMNFDSDDRIEKALHKFASSTSDFSREFVNLRGVKNFVQGPLRQETVADSAVAKLEDEVIKLKEELESLEI